MANSVPQEDAGVTAGVQARERDLREGHMDRASEAYRQAKQQAYRYLSAHGRTMHELRERLRQRGHRADVTEEVLQDLQAEGYLDDRKLALEWARYRMQAKPCGRRRLAWELRGRGLEDELRAEVIQAVYTEFDERALAERALAKRLRASASDPSLPERNRIIRHLIRLGFEPATIAAALTARFSALAPLDPLDSDTGC